MTSFLLKNKKYNLSILHDRVFGEFGFSLTAESFYVLLDTISNYATTNKISNIIFASDSVDICKKLVHIASTKIAYLGYKSCVIDRPCTSSELAWTTKQSKSPALGLYITSDYYKTDIIHIYFYLSGNPIIGTELRSLLKTSVKLTTTIYDEFIAPPEPTLLNINDYIEYLKDNNIALLQSKQPINIDTMYGSSEFLLKTIKNNTNTNITLYNLQSNILRISGYYSNPTNEKLKWFTTHPSCNASKYFFAIDGDGSKVGVYDLKTKQEISILGITILILITLKDNKNKTIILPEYSSNKLIKLCKKLNFNLLLNSNPSKYEIQKSLIYLTTNDDIIYNGDYTLPNSLLTLTYILRACDTAEKSIEELLDYYLKLYNLNWTTNIVTLDSKYINKFSLLKICNKLLNKSIKKIKPRLTSKGLLLTIKECKIEEKFTILIESRNKEVCDNITKEFLKIND